MPKKKTLMKSCSFCNTDTNKSLPIHINHVKNIREDYKIILLRYYMSKAAKLNPTPYDELMANRFFADPSKYMEQ